MDGVQIHYGAVLAAAIVAFLIGGLWYSPILFADVWMREAGLDQAKVKGANLAKVFGLSLLCSLVMAANLAAFVGPKASFTFGLSAGAAAGIGWVAMSLGVIYLFEQRSLKLWLVNSGYQVLAFTAMGAIVGGWH